MGGSSVPDIRHSGHFLEFLLKNNNDYHQAYHDITTTISPALFGIPDDANHSIWRTGDGNGSRPLKRELNSFYFYKVSILLYMCYAMARVVQNPNLSPIEQKMKTSIFKIKCFCD